MVKIARGCFPFVLAQKDPVNNDTFLITLGTYFNAKGIQAPLGTAAINWMIMAVGTAVKQFSEGPGVSRYFYMRGSADKPFEIIADGNVDLVRRKIDAFEMIHTSKELKRLGYHNSSEAVIGTYYDKSNSMLWLTTF